jgi:TfoX/Sxy family transcriptional regulator of competence genes
MDAGGLKALFEPFGPVTVKRMFGGRGVLSRRLVTSRSNTAAGFF